MLRLATRSRRGSPLLALDSRSDAGLLMGRIAVRQELARREGLNIRNYPIWSPLSIGTARAAGMFVFGMIRTLRIFLEPPASCDDKITFRLRCGQAFSRHRFRRPRRKDDPDAQWTYDGRRCFHRRRCASSSVQRGTKGMRFAYSVQSIGRLIRASPSVAGADWRQHDYRFYAHNRPASTTCWVIGCRFRRGAAGGMRLTSDSSHRRRLGRSTSARGRWSRFRRRSSRR